MGSFRVTSNGGNDETPDVPPPRRTPVLNFDSPGHPETTESQPPPPFEPIEPTAPSAPAVRFEILRPEALRRILPEKPQSRGRPSKASPERLDRIIDAVRAGNFLGTAAELNGISRDSMRDWMKDPRPKFRAFQMRVRQAEAAWEAQQVNYISQRTRLDPRLGLDALERRFRDRWGRREHSMTLRPGVPDRRRSETESEGGEHAEYVIDLTTPEVIDLYAQEFGPASPEDRQRTVALDQALPRVHRPAPSDLPGAHGPVPGDQ